MHNSIDHAQVTGKLETYSKFNQIIVDGPQAWGIFCLAQESNYSTNEPQQAQVILSQ